MPGLGGHEVHSPARIAPDRYNRTRQAGGTRTHLKLSADSLLISGGLALECTVQRDDDHVLSLLAQVCNLETRHRSPPPSRSLCSYEDTRVERASCRSTGYPRGYAGKVLALLGARRRCTPFGPFAVRPYRTPRSSIRFGG